MVLRDGSSTRYVELNLEYVLASGWPCQCCRWMSCCHKPYDKCSHESECENLKRIQEQAHLQAQTRSGFGTIPPVPMQRAERGPGCPWGLCTERDGPMGKSSSRQRRGKSRLNIPCLEIGEVGGLEDGRDTKS